MYRLKQLFPVAHVRWRTSLDEAAVRCRIADSTEPRNRFRLPFKAPAKPLEGAVTGATFRIRRIIDYRNSFLPIVNGRIYTESGQTYVDIRMRPPIGSLLFMGVWLGSMGLTCLGLLLTAVTKLPTLLRTGFPTSALIPFGMFAFGAGISVLGFRSEARWVKVFFSQLLESSESQAV